MRILLVQNEAAPAVALSARLKSAGYRVSWLRNLSDAEGALKREPETHTIVLFDHDLLQENYARLAGLRQIGVNARVLMMLSRDALAMHIDAQRPISDDFLVKPFGLSELLVRIRALSRNSHKDTIEPVFQTSVLRLDTSSRCVYREGQEIKLTAREYALLLAMILRPGACLTRYHLEERIYPPTRRVASNAIEFLIHGLRRKIGAEQIENRRGMGWRLVP